MYPISSNSVRQNMGRKLPQTPTILHNENEALKNKVKCLETTIKEAHSDIQKLMKEKEILKEENSKITENMKLLKLQLNLFEGMGIEWEELKETVKFKK